MIENYTDIMIPEEVYDLICEELNIDYINFMGIA